VLEFADGVAGHRAAAWCEFYAIATADESGSPPDATAAAKWLAPADDRQAFAAYDDDQVAGVATVNLEGPDAAFARIYVRDRVRRRGFGGRLADAVASWAHSRGLTSLRSTVIGGGPGETFARHRGAEIILRLVTVVHPVQAEISTVAAPAGVSLVRWVDATPSALLESAALLRRTVADAPGSANQFDPDARTVDWIRGWEAERTATGHHLWVSAAVHDGALVAFTEAEVAPTGGPASQHDTAVLPSWRGRGLATWLKADMLARLRDHQPPVTGLASTINSVNGPMLAVCGRLGFQRVRERLLLNCPLTTERGVLPSSR